MLARRLLPSDGLSGSYAQATYLIDAGQKSVPICVTQFVSNTIG
jgi:hypothetical protein